MMNIKKIPQVIQEFYRIANKNFKQANVSGAAIVIAYYTLVAIFPMVIFIGNILPIFHLDSSAILPYLKIAVPESVYVTLEPLLKSFLDAGSSGGVASISGLLTLWAASRGINALKKAFNETFGIGVEQGLFTQRILSFLITILIGIMLVIFFFIYSFGQQILEYITPILDLPLDWLTTFVQLKWPTTMIGIFSILCVLYLLVPNAKIHFKYLWPGALFATLGWMILTQGFSYYVRYFAHSVLTYGTLGTFIVLLFWMNYSSLVIMIGVVINASLEELEFGKIQTKRTLDHFNDKSVRRIFKRKTK